MKQGIFSSIIFIHFLALLGCSARIESSDSHKPEVPPRLKTIAGKSISISELESFIEQTMDEAGVAGLSCAVLNDSQIVYEKSFGYRNKEEGTQNDEQTLFSAASFSKPVFAYLVMLLSEDKVIDMDRPLYEYLEKPLYEYPAYTDLKGDSRYKQITARMVLSHSTGFPNWRFLEADNQLKFLFSPGERHSYSGEGIVLLQMVIEEITGEDLETLAQKRLFHPLGMVRSSYTWLPEFEANFASPHDEFGRPRGEKIQRNKPDAAGSMVTTAGDYARFLTALLNAEGHRGATVSAMLKPQIAIDYKTMFGPGAWELTDEYQNIDLSWSLGWGRFDTPFGRAFFHTGHSIGWQNYTVTYADKGIGIVMLSNSDNFESVAQQIAEKAIGDIYSPYEWLGYIPFNPDLMKKSPPPDPVAIQIDPQILAAYAGTYDMQPTATLQIKMEDDSLYIQSLDGQDWELLLAETETRFFIRGQEDYRIQFLRDGTGSTTALQLEFKGLQLPLAVKVD